MKILVLDNYDSFTYNLVHILRTLGLHKDLAVFRNDKITIEEVGQYDCVLLSPGPGIPKDAGIMSEIIREYGATKSILGVCLGHQAIGEAYGAQLYNLDEVYHGVVTDIFLKSSDPIFHEVPDSFKACRYHSWAISNKNLPQDLIVTSEDANQCVMSVKHKEYNVRGLQFHPESIMSSHGKKMIINWLEHSGK
jgi:anthranilate synthase component 2